MQNGEGATPTNNWYKSPPQPLLFIYIYIIFPALLNRLPAASQLSSAIELSEISRNNWPQQVVIQWYNTGRLEVVERPTSNYSTGTKPSLGRIHIFRHGTRPAAPAGRLQKGVKGDLCTMATRFLWLRGQTQTPEFWPLGTRIAWVLVARLHPTHQALHRQFVAQAVWKTWNHPTSFMSIKIDEQSRFIVH